MQNDNIINGQAAPDQGEFVSLSTISLGSIINELKENMKTSTFFRNSWVILIQGILMIAVSILIFKSPHAVLASLSLWLGAITLASALYGMIAWFATAKEQRDFIILTGSIAMGVIGALMISKMFIGMIAITIAFSSIVSSIGLALISGSWKGKKLWSMWWVVALLGATILITGIKSMFDIKAVAQNISTLIGVSVFLAGTGLIFLVFLKEMLLSTIKTN